MAAVSDSCIAVSLEQEKLMILGLNQTQPANKLAEHALSGSDLVDAAHPLGRSPEH